MRLKKNIVHDEENQDRWIVSYADFVTLLFAFFVVMYALSSINQTKYDHLSQSLIKAFRKTPGTPSATQENTSLLSDALSDVNTDSPITTKDNPLSVINPKNSENTNDTEFDLLKKNIHLAIEGLTQDEIIKIRESKDWIELALDSNVLFDAGSGQLTHASETILNKIAVICLKFKNPIQIEGFTDNLPVNSMHYPTNWELSSARSSAVARYFIDSGIESKRLAVVGYADNYPLVDNNLDAARKMNRRVSLVIYKHLYRERLEAISYHAPEEKYTQDKTSASDPTSNMVIKPVTLKNGTIRYTNVKQRR